MPNHLSRERSPYLLQHAENPVDWYPWGAEAFERAHREDKPVFLSIGYSTCHWCHVMAQESFENEAVAAVLNRDFIAVKVDREERPDVDAVYMEVCTALNGSGGWPLTILMTPEQKPFFAGTYLPRESRSRQLGLLPLLRAVAEKWQHDRASLLKTGEQITALLREERAPGKAAPDEELVRLAAAQLADSYDKEYGGFGTAPKFPSPHQLLFLLRYARLSGDRAARAMAEHTLRQMYRGGIFDHIGGGFARYSTDREWLTPHFEKTLYDNALLALCYTEAWQEGRLPLHRQVAEATLDYCLRELRAESGGFYSGQDADSEGEEGKYYLFTPDELRTVLGADDGRHLAECYDITAEGNFHGKSIPNLLLNQRWNLLPEGYADLRERLRLYRAARCPLGTDRKLLTGWNGLMLLALARAAWAFEDRRYLLRARELAAFLLKEAGAAEPETLRAVCYEDGAAPLPAQLEDYAFTALGFLELYRADFDPAHIAAAIGLAKELPAHFADGSGAYYQTSDRAQALLKRPQALFDGALPSGNSAAALLFDRLFRLTGDNVWQERRSALLAFLAARAERWPAGISFGLLGLLSSVWPTRELVCVAEEVPAALRTVSGTYAPELTLLLKRPGDAALAALCPFTAGMAQRDGKPTFYLCQNGSCGLPFTADELPG
ncbi:MAG: thioredoxin domain-containing protein [Eubacteriales bacterium]|nr:thioredoxin domain-containing protein [Eubacteriales bacterium]